MNKFIISFIAIILLSTPFIVNATTTPGTILDSLVPSRKNCNYVTNKLYEPFSDINEDFPGIKDLMQKGKNEVNCIKIDGGTENLLRLVFSIGISIIIILTIINIAVSGIQYMTEQATGQIKGGAKKRLKDSVIALGLGLLSYTILYTVNKQLVNFTFNPVSIDINKSIDKGINSANNATGSFSSDLGGIEFVGQPTTPNPLLDFYNQPSPTGWVNPYTKQPCTPIFTPTTPNTQQPLGLNTKFLASVYQVFALETNPNGFVPTGDAYNPQNPFPVNQNSSGSSLFSPASQQQTTNTTDSVGQPCVKQDPATLTGGINTPFGTPGTGVVASLTTKDGNRGEGTIYVEGIPYSFRSGPFGKGYLPVGTYTLTFGDWSITEGGQSIRGRREEPRSMTVPAQGRNNNLFGYSFNISDKADPRNGGVTRTELRIHPDGYPNGTEGCIGIVGDVTVQEKFFNQMTALLQRSGGSYTLTVN